MTIEEAKKKWEIDKAMKHVQRLAEADHSLNKFKSYDSWRSVKAYICLLELELESYRRKEKDGVRVQSK